MLEINPYFRPSAQQLLKNPVFDGSRIPKNEVTAPCKEKINIDCKDQAIDYENCEFKADLNI